MNCAPFQMTVHLNQTGLLPPALSRFNMVFLDQKLHKPVFHYSSVGRYLLPPHRSEHWVSGVSAHLPR